MSFIGSLFQAIGSIFSPPQNQQPQFMPPAPTPAPAVPDRSDAEVQQAAARQRRRYGITGGASSNMMTTGMGVSPSSTYNAVTAVLGGGSPSG